MQSAIANSDPGAWSGVQGIVEIVVTPGLRRVGA